MNSKLRIFPLVALVLSTVLALWAICTSDPYYGFWAFLLALVLLFAIVLAVPLAGAGVWFLSRMLARRLRIDAESRRTPQIFPDVPIRNVLPWKPQRLAPITINLPSFGYYCGFLFNILMFVFITFQTPRTPTGLLIPMAMRNPGAGLTSPPTETLGVYVPLGGVFAVNGEAVTRDQLREKLRQELGKRVVWTVYVEGDDDVEFARVVFVFDTIKALGAEAYWITPRVRENWNKQSRP